jgi:hypothetical protein
METQGLVRCPRCNRRVFGLFKLTVEDIQREHSPEEMGIYWGVCWDCREMYRSAARLEVDYETSKALRDSLLLIPLLFGTLFLLKLSVPSAGIFFYAVAFLTGMKYLFRKSIGRYSFTHNFAWSIRNNNTIIGISLIVASVVAVLVPL